MRALRKFFQRLIASTKRRQNEDRLQEEIEAHLALQIADNIRSGLSPAEARRQAVLKFGAVEAMKESYRDQRRIPFLETLIQDVRYALRRLRNAPAFTATTVLILALGIGATTSIFTLVYAVLLKSLAVTNPDELYKLCGVAGRAIPCVAIGFGTAHGCASKTGESKFRVRPGPAYRGEHESHACRLRTRPTHATFIGVFMIHYRTFPAFPQWLSANTRR